MFESFIKEFAKYFYVQDRINLFENNLKLEL